MIEIFLNGERKQTQKDLVGQMKEQLKSLLKVQKISQICCISGDQFLGDDKNISEFKAPYNFYTAQYVQQLEKRNNSVVAQFEEKCGNYDRLSQDYIELKEKLNAIQVMGTENEQQQYHESESEIFLPKNVDEFKIQIDAQKEEIKYQKQQLDQYRIDLNEQKYQNGILMLQMKQSQQGQYFDDIQQTNIELKAKIDNLHEQIAKLEEENNQLQNKTKQDFLKISSIRQRNSTIDQQNIIHNMELNQKKMYEENIDQKKQLLILKQQIDQLQHKIYVQEQDIENDKLINQLSEKTREENLNLKFQIELLKKNIDQLKKSSK